MALRENRFFKLTVARLFNFSPLARMQSRETEKIRKPWKIERNRPTVKKTRNVTAITLRRCGSDERIENIEI